MALIKWMPDFEIGIPAIDHEHRELIELINRLHARLSANATKEEVDEFLGEVHADISAHFALEEKAMRDMGYARYESHKADHERLLDEIRDIMDAFNADAYFDYGGSLAEGLRVWFTEHFRTMDSHLHHVVHHRA